MHWAMIFIDGFGLGAEENNPVVSAKTPLIDSLLGGHLLWGNRIIKQDEVVLRPIDASLGVPGVPQSATGQTTLWTGVNAAKVLGYHLNAYPNEILAKIISEKSIFKQVKELGKHGMFANAFTDTYDDLIKQGKRRHTASTLSALAGEVMLRRIPNLREGKAVYRDITNLSLQEMGEAIPIISPFKAGENFGHITLEYDFTLYEFFQTDVLGHKQRWAEAIRVVEQLDEFLAGFMSVVKRHEVGWILTSDHGNIEDFSIKGHTNNCVPALCWSANSSVNWPEWSTLEEITPGLLELMHKIV